MNRSYEDRRDSDEIEIISEAAQPGLISNLFQLDAQVMIARRRCVRSYLFIPTAPQCSNAAIGTVKVILSVFF